MKAKELIKILETNPELEVLFPSSNPEKPNTLDPATIVTGKAEKETKQFWDMMDGESYTSKVWVLAYDGAGKKVWVVSTDYDYGH
jgi:hypothetical protein